MTSTYKSCPILPTDYSDYGGEVAHSDQNDCSCCIHFAPLYDEKTRRYDPNFGVCLKKTSPRHGLMTFKHQAGFGCCEIDDEKFSVLGGDATVTDCKILPTDYSTHGGKVVRFQNPDQAYPLCGWGCKYFCNLSDPFDYRNHTKEFGVCRNSESPRYGLLTYWLQAGLVCYSK